MFKKSGINAETMKVRLLRKLYLSAYADEGDSAPSSDEGNGNSPTINYETLIANARKEEKDKLYPRIKKLEEDNRNLIQSQNDTLIKLAEAQKKLEELEKAGDSEEVVKLKDDLAKAQADLESFKATTPSEEDIRKKVEAEYEVKYYLQSKLTENADNILEVFVNEVQGATKEEVDASIESAKKKTVDIKKQLGLVDEEGNPVEAKKPKTEKKSPKVEKPPVSNPSNEGDEGFDFDYIQNLDPRSPEYAEFRKKMGLK